MTSNKWTEKAEEELRDLWGKGWTAAEIERYFDSGFSRNAIIGKAHRLGLEKRSNPVQQKKPAPVKTSSPKPKIKDIPIQGVKMIDLKPNDCRWPIGDPKHPDFCFCAMPTRGHVYCENHRRISTSAYRKDIEHEE